MPILRPLNIIPVSILRSMILWVPYPGSRVLLANVIRAKLPTLLKTPLAFLYDSYRRNSPPRGARTHSNCYCQFCKRCQSTSTHQYQSFRVLILQVLPGTQSFSAQSTPGTGKYSVIFSSKYYRYWQVLSHFQLEVLQVLAGTQVILSLKYPRPGIIRNV